jgi:endonuclease VIII
MEGPSIVIACEELAPFLRRKIDSASGSALFASELKGRRLKQCFSWGKHLVLVGNNFSLRIHFLMFGSYRINDPRVNRFPKLELKIGADKIFFYSCAIKKIPGDIRHTYDSSIDLMSKKWSGTKARHAIARHPKAEVADILMDQTIFAGFGNIIKNEVLFRLKMHPETLVEELSPAQASALVAEAHRYSLQFYRWKKANVLKRNWLIFRKRTCPECGGAVTKRPTGKLKRMSHFCENCQAQLDSHQRMAA